MTQAASFSTAHKNALLATLVGNILTLYAALVGKFTDGSTELKIYSSPYGNTSAPLDASFANVGNAAYWGSAIGGTAPFNMSWLPNASANAVWARWRLYHATAGYNTNVDGLVTLTGGGGMLIVPSLAFATGVNVQLAATFKMPLNNGGTLNINGTLANNLLSTLIYDVNQPKMGIDGTLTIYGGTQPATADTPITNQTPLCSTYTLTNGSFGSALGGSIATNVDVTATGPATGTGTATWFRWVKGGNVMDGSVGTAGSGVDMIVASTEFVQGQAAPAITSFILTFP